MISFESIINELESICTKHVDLGNGVNDKFFRFDAEFSDAMRSTIGFVMLLQPFKTYLRGSQSAIYKYYEIGFSILKETQRGEYDNTIEKYDDTEAIALDIIARIRNYSTSLEGSPSAFQYFDFSTYIGQPIVFTADDRIGWDVTFTIKEQISLNWPTGQIGKWTDHPVI